MADDGKKVLISSDWFSLNENSLYDRIINVCFYSGIPTGKKTGNGKEDYGDSVRKFFIRSDYMPYYEGKYYSIRKVRFKPSISFSAELFPNKSRTAAIEAKLEIRNFFLFDTDGRLLQTLSDFNDAGRKIYEIRIQMGYFGSFEKMADDLSLDTFEKLMDNFDEDLNRYGITTFKSTSSAFYIQTDGIPPNASISANLFLASSSPIAARAETVEYEFGGLPDDLTGILSQITGYDNSDILMTDYDKERFGRMMMTKEDGRTLLILNKAKKEMTMSRLLNEMCVILGMNLKFQLLPEGKLTVSVPFEADREHSEDESQASWDELYGEYLEGRTVDFYDHRIPVIYNIAYSEFAEITCPFFFWVNSMDYIEISTDYAKTSIVDYFKQSKTKSNRYSVLYCSLEFDTTGKGNMMKITAKEE